MAAARTVLHYCGDTVVGMTKGGYTIMFEHGDGHHSCHGSSFNPPVICEAKSSPRAVCGGDSEWEELGPRLSDKMGRLASGMLDRWRPVSQAVGQGDRGLRTVNDWPRPWLFPCCNTRGLGESTGLSGVALASALLQGTASQCRCHVDVPPKKGQAPRAKPKTSYRPQFNTDGSLRTDKPASNSIGKD
jgi:hypothetical protein